MSLLPSGLKTAFSEWLDKQTPPLDGIEAASALRGWYARDAEIETLKARVAELEEYVRRTGKTWKAANGNWND